MSSFRRFAFAILGLAALAAAFPASALADSLTVTFPTLGMAAQTEPLAVQDGELGLPRDPDDLGIYDTGGNLLVVGHVDWAGQRRLLAYVRTFQPGDPIELSDGRGYHVEWTRQIGLDDDADFADAVAPADDVLTLITCSGPFSVSRHEYLERTIIRAVRDD